MDIDDKAKEYTEYIANQINPFLEDSRDLKDIRHILFKSLKAFWNEFIKEK